MKEKNRLSVLQLVARDLKEEVKRGSLEPCQAQKIAFLSEQLSLSLLPPQRRRYSPDLLAMAGVWKTISAALYKQLLNEDLLCLPSTGHLVRLSKALETDIGMSEATVTYLKARVQQLDDKVSPLTKKIG